jgi:hypothetical protein
MKMMARMKVQFGVVLSAIMIAFSFLSTPTFAQESGRLSGVLLDPQNAVVVGARVTVANEKRKYIAYSDDIGRFQFETPTGSYKVSVDSSGFKQYMTDEITVAPGSKTDLSISLSPVEGPICILVVQPNVFTPLAKTDAPAAEKIQPRKIQ